MKLCLTNLTNSTIVVNHKLTIVVKHKLITFVKHLTIIVKHWLTIFRQQYMCLKTENCCLKFFVEIRANEKTYKNT